MFLMDSIVSPASMQQQGWPYIIFHPHPLQSILHRGNYTLGSLYIRVVISISRLLEIILGMGVGVKTGLCTENGLNYLQTLQLTPPPTDPPAIVQS